MRRSRVVVDARRFRAVAVAKVDEHDVVSIRDEVVSDLAVPLVCFVVGGVEHDCWESTLDEGPVARGPVDVEREAYAISHRNHYILRQHDSILRDHGASRSLINLPPHRCCLLTGMKRNINPISLHITLPLPSAPRLNFRSLRPAA